MPNQNENYHLQTPPPSTSNFRRRLTSSSPAARTPGSVRSRVTLAVADRWRNLTPRGWRLISSPAVRKAANQSMKSSTRKVWLGPEGKTAGRAEKVRNRFFGRTDRYICNRTFFESQEGPLSESPILRPSFDSSQAQTNAIPEGAKGSLFLSRSPSKNSGISLQKKSKILDFTSNDDPEFSEEKAKPRPIAKERRKIADKPAKALDAIGILQRDHFQLVDWSFTNIIVSAFRKNTYLWVAKTGEVVQLCDLSQHQSLPGIHEGSLGTSVKWNYEGTHLGLGTDGGTTLIYDGWKAGLVRSLIPSEMSEVNVMDWAQDGTLSVGFTSGKVQDHDLRVKNSLVREWVAHDDRRVECLQWKGSELLATGGGDSMVKVWDRRSMTGSPITKMKHRSTVKAIAWCPWDTSILASGGGSKDATINIWNVSAPSLGSSSTTSSFTPSSHSPFPLMSSSSTMKATLLSSTQGGASVSCLLWSTRYRELLSTHGITSSERFYSGPPTSNMNIWRFDNREKTNGNARLTILNRIAHAHAGKTIYASLCAADGQHVASIGQDECLKLWKVFEKKPEMVSRSERKGEFTRESIR